MITTSATDLSSAGQWSTQIFLMGGVTKGGGNDHPNLPPREHHYCGVNCTTSGLHKIRNSFSPTARTYKNAMENFLGIVITYPAICAVI